MEPADAHGVEIESKGQLDLILESHNFGNLYANSEKPPETIEKRKQHYKSELYTEYSHQRQP